MDGTRPLHPSLHLGREITTLLVTFLIGINLIKDFPWYNYRVYNLSLWFDYFLLICLMLFWCLISYWKDLYTIISYQDLGRKGVEYFKTYCLYVVIVVLIYHYVPSPQFFKKFAVAISFGFPTISILLNLTLLGILYLYKHNKATPKSTLIAGVGSFAGEVEKNLSLSYKDKHELKGFIKCKNEVCTIGQDKVIGDIDHIDEYLNEHHVDEIVIALPVKQSKKIKAIIQKADHYGIRVKYIPDYAGLLGSKFKTVKYGCIDAINVRQLPLDKTSAFLLKNTFDKVFAISALFALLPIFLLLAVLIKLESSGPVFYCPLRIGKGGKAFKLFKFRSMYVNDATSGGTLSTQQNDPRITKIGRILRKYSIDELPQFLNVLLGDMSVVGPRPHRGYLNQQLQASVDKYMIRHYFKPGITGWAQINGWRGPTDTLEQRLQRTNHDIWYMENWTFLLDLKIIYKTVFSVKAHKAAF